MFHRQLLILITIALSSLAQSANAASNSLQIGANIGIIPDGSYSLTQVGYEGAISSAITLGGRIYSFDYDIEEDFDLNYKEEGSGSGIEFVFRYYPRKKALRGFYFGSAVGFANADWSWTENLSAPGSGESTLLTLGFVLGGKFYFGESSVYIQPSLYVPYYLALDTSTSDGEDEITFSIAPSGGLTLGFVF